MTERLKVAIVQDFALPFAIGEGLDHVLNLTQERDRAIIAPTASSLPQADDRPTMLVAKLDLSEIGRGLGTMDVDGNHARPDIFELRIDRRARTGIVDVQNQASADA